MVNIIGSTTPTPLNRRVTRKSEANTAELPMTEGADSNQRTVVYERRKGRERRKQQQKALLDLRAKSDRRKDGRFPSVDIDV